MLTASGKVEAKDLDKEVVRVSSWSSATQLRWAPVVEIWRVAVVHGGVLSFVGADGCAGDFGTSQQLPEVDQLAQRMYADRHPAIPLPHHSRCPGPRTLPPPLVLCRQGWSPRLNSRISTQRGSAWHVHAT